MIEHISHVLNETIMITSFVIVMMVIIEFINVSSRGWFDNKLNKSPWKQIMLAWVVAVIPGCLGPYVVVSLYTHGIISFGALVCASVTSIGDEAFVMLSLFPSKALSIIFIVSVIGIVSGFIVHYLFKNKAYIQSNKHFEVHHHEDEGHFFSLKTIKENFIKISFTRATLIFGLCLFIYGIATGGLGHESEHDHGNCEHGIDWVSISFIVVALFALYAIISVSEHFLEEHLWGHVIKKHFLRIFLWTFGALIFIEVVMQYVNVEQWVDSHYVVVLALALLIGVIPVSGPHLIFVTLFASGTIPLSILLANSIVQDGHGGIPLLAESRRSFILLKLTTITIGSIVGAVGYYMGI